MRIIECRYEFVKRGGKEFSDWFKVGVVEDDTLSDKEVLKSYKEKIKDIDKVTKLKHEYRIK